MLTHTKTLTYFITSLRQIGEIWFGNMRVLCVFIVSFTFLSVCLCEWQWVTCDTCLSRTRLIQHLVCNYAFVAVSNRACVYLGSCTMGCTMCSQLIDMWSVSERHLTRRAMELTALPEAAQRGYHRATGLHYMSSFSDAEDCCDDTSTSSSLTMEWQAGAGDWCVQNQNYAQLIEPTKMKNPIHLHLVISQTLLSTATYSKYRDIPPEASRVKCLAQGQCHLTPYRNKWMKTEKTGTMYKCFLFVSLREQKKQLVKYVWVCCEGVCKRVD